jgi:hypothetical protein
MQQEVLLAYPNFNKLSDIHTDASHLQLGGVISQDGKPIACYSHKLNPVQTHYAMVVTSTTSSTRKAGLSFQPRSFRNTL